MYEEYWGLTEPAFSLTPDPKFLYLGKKHADCLTMLTYAVSGNKGAAMITGEVGCGKTTLSRKLLLDLDTDKYQIAMIVNPVLTPVQFLMEVMEQFGEEDPPRNRQVLVKELNEKLLQIDRAGRRAVLLIDEAHLIRDRGTFEEIRLLLNFQLNDRFLLSLLLMGQPELRPKVERIPALMQRIAVRGSVGPLDEHETEQMIDFRLKQAWHVGENTIFTPDAVRELHGYTKGYPRLICELADNALLVGMVNKARHIDGFLMKSVIMDFEGKEW
jgi:general secretion pathway protein A